MADRSRDGMTIGHWLPLLGITLSAFIFNTSEFMPIGLLTDIGFTFGLTEAGTGVMISVYAWSVMLLSLPLMIVGSRLEFRRLMLIVLAVFSAGQFLSAAAPSFPILVLARLVVASAHAIFWSVAAVMATRLVDESHGPLAISMVATGTSIAMIFGLPLGRAIGLAVGWRMTFFLVGAISVAVLIYQAICLPPMPAGEPFRLGQLPSLLRNRQLVAIFVVTLLFASAYYTGYSYIEPFLARVGGIEAGAITGALTVFGVAGLAGSAILTRLYDRHRSFFMSLSIAGVAASLALLVPAAGSLGLVIAVCVLWGICGTMYSIAFQAEVIRATDRDTSSVAMSIFSGIFNLGIGSGTAFGGVVVTALGIESVGFVGAAIGAAALVCCLATLVLPAASKVRAKA
ncbi:MFS transporter [Collinsella vaginalis]|uniref:MFS transporter n=1 Tax=Collinsella vaginalis TaxID=1870987 RepID=UPI000A272331|nr:MFS transporter [Collinsella vaginalis]